MRRMINTVITITMLVAVTTACWDLHYMDYLGIVVGMGIDTGENNPEHFTVSLQVVNPKSVSPSFRGGQTKAPSVLYTGEGKSVVDAIRQAAYAMPRRPYFAHNQILVIGEELARKDIVHLLDLLDRDPEIRNDFRIIVTRNVTAQQILSQMSTLEDVPARSIEKMTFANDEINDMTYPVTVKEFIKKMEIRGVEPALASIEIVGPPEAGASKAKIENIKLNSFMKMGPMGLVREGKLVGFFTEEASKGFVWAQGKVKNAAVTVPCSDEEKFNALENFFQSSRIRAAVKDGRPQADIFVRVRANIAEVRCHGTHLDTSAAFDEMEEALEREIGKKIELAIESAKQLRADVFGFGKKIYISSPSYWREHEDDWPALFADLPITVRVQAEVASSGTKIESYLDKVKEVKR